MKEVFKSNMLKPQKYSNTHKINIQGKLGMDSYSKPLKSLKTNTNLKVTKFF